MGCDEGGGVVGGGGAGGAGGLGHGGVGGGFGVMDGLIWEVGLWALVEFNSVLVCYRDGGGGSREPKTYSCSDTDIVIELRALASYLAGIKNAKPLGSIGEFALAVTKGACASALIVDLHLAPDSD